jgi:hypothetical protein
MCCVKHLKHIVVSKFKFVVNELRCEECCEKAVENNRFMDDLGWSLFIVCVCVIGFLIWIIWNLWNEEQKWKKVKKEHGIVGQVQLGNPLTAATTEKPPKQLLHLTGAAFTVPYSLTAARRPRQLSRSVRWPDRLNGDCRG